LLLGVKQNYELKAKRETFPLLINSQNSRVRSIEIDTESVALLIFLMLIDRAIDTAGWHQAQPRNILSNLSVFEQFCNLLMTWLMYQVCRPPQSFVGARAIARPLGRPSVSQTD
jgi:hypothetical protein